MKLSWTEIKERALAFSKEWEDEYSEEAEAKSFWDGFFNIFGLTRRRVASFEKPIKKTDGRGGYIDLLWKGVLLVEHKSKGKDLDKAVRQAKEYFPGIEERDLPRYIIVSDFSRFKLYDLDTDQEYEFLLKDLHNKIRLFGFIAGFQTRSFGEQDPVNIQAAEKLGKLRDLLDKAGYHGRSLEIFLARILFCLFADDTSIFERRAFRDYIEMHTKENGSDLGLHLAQIWQILNTPINDRSKKLDDDIASFTYINGRLFEEILPLVTFDTQMRKTLLECCGLDWSRISPSIFGSLFQSIMDKKARRNLGAHYTSETNILKAIGPLFLDQLYSDFNSIKHNSKQLKIFQKKLNTIRILDPACGCGNFLVIAYRELRLLELNILIEIHKLERTRFLDIEGFIYVDVDQFYEIELEEFPAQIAQLALWLVDHQMNLKISEEFGKYFVRLPLKKSPTIICGNALQIDWQELINANNLSYIIGNPPFVGHHLQTPAQKQDMLAVYGKNIKSAGVMDYVTAWFIKAADYIQNTKVKVAFVSTNSITQGEQVGILWRALLKERNLYIHFAHQTFKWTNEASGKAAVYCVIIGFASFDTDKKNVFEYIQQNEAVNILQAKQINAYLVDAPWILLENRSKNPFGMPNMVYGNKPTDEGHFLFSDEEKTSFLEIEPRAEKFIKPFMSAEEYLNGKKRWVLWLVDAKPDEIARMPKVLERVKAVDAFRKASRAKATRSYPHPTLFRQITQPKNDYILIPCCSSENRLFIPFGFFNKSYIVGNTCLTLPGATLYHFGVLQSTMHMAWVRAVCGRLKRDYRYSKDIVYNNFPWPNSNEKQMCSIEQAAQGVLDVRAQYPDSTLADLYNKLTMPPDLVKAHQVLDKAVDHAYRKSIFKNESERVSFLFTLYLEFMMKV